MKNSFELQTPNFRGANPPKEVYLFIKCKWTLSDAFLFLNHVHTDGRKNIHRRGLDRLNLFSSLT